MSRSHRYDVHVRWTGAGSEGTRTYSSYQRRLEAVVRGAVPLTLSADSAFRGDSALPNPEDLLVTALASCHMLSFLAECAKRRVAVLAYEDRAEGTLDLDASGHGQFTAVWLRPLVTVAAAAEISLAMELHEVAHGACFIARSCNFPVHHRATTVVAPAADRAPQAAGHA